MKSLIIALMLGLTVSLPYNISLLLTVAKVLQRNRQLLYLAQQQNTFA